MSLFGRKEKAENDKLNRQVNKLSQQVNRLSKENEFLQKDNMYLNRRVNTLESLCDEKDDAHKATISDGLRHGSSRAAREMADRKKYLKNQGK